MDIAELTDLDPDQLVEADRMPSRTSPRSGIRKAAAVRKNAKILVTPAYRIETLADVSALMADPHRLGMVEADLAEVEGRGQGLRMGYIWITAGDDNHATPDRHVLRWVREGLGRTVLVVEARELLVEVAGILSVTPWVLDHAIWKLMAKRGVAGCGGNCSRESRLMLEDGNALGLSIVFPKGTLSANSQHRRV